MSIHIIEVEAEKRSYLGTQEYATHLELNFLRVEHLVWICLLNRLSSFAVNTYSIFAREAYRGWHGPVAVVGLAGGEAFAVRNRGASIKVVGLYQIGSFQFLFLIRSDESSPQGQTVVQVKHLVGPFLTSLVVGVNLLVIVEMGEMLISGANCAQIGRALLFVGQCLGILDCGAAVQQQVVTTANHIGDELVQNVSLRVGESRFNFVLNLHHLVAYKIDGILLHFVVASRQNFGSTRNLIFMSIHLKLSAHSRFQSLQRFTVHRTHGNTILHNDVFRYSYIDIRVGTNLARAVAGLDAFVGSKFVVVFPVVVVCGGKVPTKFGYVVVTISGSGFSSSGCCRTYPHSSKVVRTLTQTYGNLCTHLETIVGIVGIADF